MTIKLHIRPRVGPGMPLEEFTEVVLDGDSDEALANVLQASLRGHLWEVEERDEPELDQDWDDL